MKLASLDGPGRGYRYRNPLGSLGCSCETGPAITKALPVKSFTTDLALSNQGKTSMKDLLDKSGIAYTDNVSTLTVAKPDGSTVSVPALVPHDQVNSTIASLQTSLQEAQKDVAIAVSQLTPEQKKWGKWLLIGGAGFLAYQFFKKPKNKGLGKLMNTGTKKKRAAQRAAVFAKLDEQGSLYPKKNGKRTKKRKSKRALRGAIPTISI